MDPLLKTLQEEVRASAAACSPEQLIWHPAGKWSASAILEHLYLTYTGTTKGFQRVLAAGSPKVTAATWKQRGGAVLVFGFSYLPSGREAPSFSRPRGLASETVRSEIEAKIAEMDAILSTCETKFGARTKVLDHAILGPLTIHQWRKFHLVHGRHHIKQIRRLRAAAESD